MHTWISDRAKKASVELAYNAEDVVVDELSVGFVVSTAPRNVLELDVERLEDGDECLQDFQGCGDYFDANTVTGDRRDVVGLLLAGHDAGHDAGRLGDRGVIILCSVI